MLLTAIMLFSCSSSAEEARLHKSGLSGIHMAERMTLKAQSKLHITQQPHTKHAAVKDEQKPVSRFTALPFPNKVCWNALRSSPNIGCPIAGEESQPRYTLSRCERESAGAGEGTSRKKKGKATGQSEKEGSESEEQLNGSQKHKWVFPLYCVFPPNWGRRQKFTL